MNILSTKIFSTLVTILMTSSACSADESSLGSRPSPCLPSVIPGVWMDTNPNNPSHEYMLFSDIKEAKAAFHTRSNPLSVNNAQDAILLPMVALTRGDRAVKSEDKSVPGLSKPIRAFEYKGGQSQYMGYQLDYRESEISFYNVRDEKAGSSKCHMSKHNGRIYMMFDVFLHMRKIAPYYSGE